MTQNQTRFQGTDEEFWDAVSAASDPDLSEEEAIENALLLQEILTLAQDALTRPTAETLPVANTIAAVPPKLVARPKPGDLVTVERAVELFAEAYVMRPVGPNKESAISAVRDYRVHDGQLQYNMSYPPDWKESAGKLEDAQQWQVVCQQHPETDGVARASRTTVRTGTA